MIISESHIFPVMPAGIYFQRRKPMLLTMERLPFSRCMILSKAGTWTTVASPSSHAFPGICHLDLGVTQDADLFSDFIKYRI